MQEVIEVSAAEEVSEADVLECAAGEAADENLLEDRQRTNAGALGDCACINNVRKDVMIWALEDLLARESEKLRYDEKHRAVSKARETIYQASASLVEDIEETLAMVKNTPDCPVG